MPCAAHRSPILPILLFIYICNISILKHIVYYAYYVKFMSYNVITCCFAFCSFPINLFQDLKMVRSPTPPAHPLKRPAPNRRTGRLRAAHGLRPRQPLVRAPEKPHERGNRRRRAVATSARRARRPSRTCWPLASPPPTAAARRPTATAPLGHPPPPPPSR